VIPCRALHAAELIAPAPDHFRAADERVVDGTLQRLPPQGCVRAEEIRREPACVEAADKAGGVVPVRIRGAKIDVRGFADVLIPTDVADVAQIASFVRMEQILAGVAAEYLPGGLEKKPGVRNQPRQRDSRIVN